MKVGPFQSRYRIEETLTSPTDPTLVLLHGATLNSRMWDAVRRHLNPKYRVIAPDLPGHGSRLSEPFTLAGAVETALASVASLGGAPVILVGDSLGGYTSQAAAPRIPPEQLKGLVLGGSTAVLKGANVLPFMAVAGLFRLLIAGFGEPRLIRAMVPRSLRRQGLAEQDIQSLAEAGLSVRVFGTAVAELRRFEALENLAAIAAPILFVNGDRDINMVRGEAQFLARARRARAHRFAKCGHGVSMLRSTEFAGLVNDFAAECSTDPAR